ncbi:MAG TPA: rhomboid family intramembrane serine protease [Candidatus Nanoarchaeia archaeon]|nr:rhomboid family intramembrane serine protease [Candidatus Nanoarchaeia archaeon]
MKIKGIALLLSGFCILVFIMQLVFPSTTGLILLDQNSFSQPWRFLTAIFAHGGAGHLLYNIFALALFGSILEYNIGSRKFALIFFVTGIVANIIAVNFYPSSLGASGAIFGVIGAIVVLRPSLVVWAFGLPMPMFVAGILWAAGDIIGIFVPSNVGNIAHLAGMAIGLLFGAVYRNWRYQTRSPTRAYINENHIRDWENRYLS